MSSVTVSVIIPVYNVAEFLDQCLESIVRQTHANLQIICVDDGSTDSSRSILDRHSRLDGRIVVLSQSHTNAGDARNAGLDIASGDFLAILDSDDYFAPDYIEALLDAALSCDADIVACRSMAVSHKTGAITRIDWAVPDIESGIPFSSTEVSDLFNQFKGWPWDKLFRRSFIADNELRFQSLTSTNDAFFVYGALWLARRIVVVDGYLAFHRVENTQSTEATRRWQNFFAAAEALEQRLAQDELWSRAEDSFVAWLVEYCIWSIRTLPDSAARNIAKRLRTDVIPRVEEHGGLVERDGERYLRLLQKEPAKVALDLVDISSDRALIQSILVEKESALADTENALRDANRWLAETESELGNARHALADAEAALVDAKQHVTIQQNQIAALESQLHRYAFIIRPIRIINRARRRLMRSR